MNYKVRDIIRMFKIQENQSYKFVDKLVYGTKDSAVDTIVTTFKASQEVIEKSIELNADLILTHESVYYDHHNKEVKNSRVFKTKHQLIQESNISIYRLHDFLHRIKPDYITYGLIHSLNWNDNIVCEKETFSIVEIEEKELEEIIMYLKKRLNIQYIKAIGRPQQKCIRLGITVGYRGHAENAIPLYEEYQLDSLLIGEGPEWETEEYVYDSIKQGNNISLITLGHRESEEPGMAYVAKLLKEKFPTLKVHNIKQKQSSKIY